MNEAELKDLSKAVTLLENPNLTAQISGIIGIPIEKAIKLLPNKATDSLGNAVQKAIHAALYLSIKTMKSDPSTDTAPPEASNLLHSLGSATSGAVGGAFGVFALAIELPISTCIMMRSIADIARSEGANLEDVETQLECVQVLGLGGSQSSSSAIDIGYWAAREAMTKAVHDAAAHVAKKGLEKESAPAIVRLINLIAERYSLTVSEKAAGQLVPVIGAVSGAIINTLFIDHYQNMARGHFTLRRLERKHGVDLVRQKYLEFKARAHSATC